MCERRVKFHLFRGQAAPQDGKREEGGMPQVLEAHAEDELRRELSEAREQQAATNVILRS
jgi:hypothetical protein